MWNAYLVFIALLDGFLKCVIYLHVNFECSDLYSFVPSFFFLFARQGNNCLPLFSAISSGKSSWNQVLFFAWRLPRIRSSRVDISEKNNQRFLGLAKSPVSCVFDFFFLVIWSECREYNLQDTQKQRLQRSYLTGNSPFCCYTSFLWSVCCCRWMVIFFASCLVFHFCQY